MSWYQIGTVAVTNGSHTVTGTNTTWLTDASDGDLFTIDGDKIYQITGVSADGTLTIDPAWAGATAGGLSYSIINISLTNGALAARMSELLRLWQNRENEMVDWLTGTTTGGPHSDGTYPLTDTEGNVEYVKAPAWITSVLGDPTFTTAQDIIDTLQPVADQILPIESQITTVAGISGQVQTVASMTSQIGTLTSLTSQIGTLSSISGNITTVAGITSQIGTIAAMTTQIGTLSGISTDVTTVAGISGNVTSVAGMSTQVGTLASISANISTVAGVSADVTTVAGIHVNVTSVAGMSSQIGTLSSISGNITTVAGISSQVQTVASMTTQIGTLLSMTTQIGTLASISGNITTVAGISGDVSTVAGIAAQVSSAQANAQAAEDAVSASAFKFTVSTTTAMADPGAGTIRFNNATLASVTQIAIAATSADTGNPDISDVIASWDDSTHTPRGTITFRKRGASGTYITFGLNGNVSDNTTWLQLPLSYVSSAGTITNGDQLFMSFSRAGNDGTGVGDMLARNNLSDVDDITTAKTNLGLGTGDSPQFAGLTITGTSQIDTLKATQLDVAGTVQVGSLGATIVGQAVFTAVDQAAARTALGVSATAVPIIITAGTTTPAVTDGPIIYQADVSGGPIVIDLANAPQEITVLAKAGVTIDATNYIQLKPPAGKKIFEQAAGDTVSIRRSFHSITLRKNASGNYA